MAQDDPPPAPPLPHVPGGRPPIARGWVFLAMVLLLGFIGQQAYRACGEWGELRAELSQVRQSAVIGYPNIGPRFSYAQRPEAWFRDEGDFTYLWGGWDTRVGHRWFRFERGSLEPGSLTLPIGRDVIRAIDEPVLEEDGGVIWGRIPDESDVVGLELGEIPRVYPLLVLRKVLAVNDVIDRRPVLLAFNSSGPPVGPVAAYEAVLDGGRVTLGTSGYARREGPILYDRESESLWLAETGVLRAIAGPRKGRTLRRLARPDLVTWGDWRRRHPESRLVVGSADRPAAVPVASVTRGGR